MKSQKSPLSIEKVTVKSGVRAGATRTAYCTTAIRCTTTG